MRDLEPLVIDVVESNAIEPAYLAEFYFDSGTIYLWSGLGDFTWAGNTYSGGGNLISISDLQENEGLEAANISCVLTGVPSTLNALALLENPRGRRMVIYLMFLSKNRLIVQENGDKILLESGGAILTESDLVGEPVRVFTGQMDTMTIDDSGAESSITINGESSRIIGQRAKKRRYTNEEQRKIFVNDLGLEFIPNLKDKELVW